MKTTILKSILLILGIFAVTFSHAQVWGVPGATWHYEFDDFGQGFYTYTYSGDTIVDGFNCQKIDVELQWIITGNGVTIPGALNQYTEITRFSNDSVFWYRNNDFFLLYDFGASIGDQWVIHQGGNLFDPECDTTSIVSVSDTGVVTINGQDLRFIELTYVQGQYAMNGRAIERIGVANASWHPQNLPFPGQVTCDSNIITEYFFHHFRCYTDNDLGTYSTVNEACDQPTATLYLEELLIKDDKEVIRMFNLLGREIQNPKNELVIILYSDGSTEKKFID